MFDDVLETMLKDKDMLSIFSIFLHHMNLCRILLSQNIMSNNDLYHNILRQANYLLIVLDLRPGTDDKIRVWQNLPFVNENMYVFQ